MIVTQHVLSWLVAVPFAAAVALAALGLAGARRPSTARAIALAAMASEALLATYLFATFDRGASRLDGHGGYQFVERALLSRSLGVEWHLGLDGLSAPLLLATALLGLAGVVVSLTRTQRVESFFAAHCLFVGAAMGALVALDLLLFFALFELAIAAIVLLVHRFGAPAAAAKLALSASVGAALLSTAIVLLSSHADPTAPPFSMQELARIDDLGRGGTFAGVGLVEALFVATFVPFALTMAVVPMHAWLPDVLADAPAAVGVLAAGVLVPLGGYAILRVDFGILPEGSAWAAPTLAALGALSVLYAALRAMTERDVARLVAYAATGNAGFALLAMASMTPTGLEGAVVHLTSHALIVALLLLLVGALRDRVGHRELDRFGGLARETPLHASLLALALFASMGLPGLSGFVGQAMALVGAFPVFRVATLAAALGAVLAVAWQARAIERLLLGSPREDLRTSPLLEPHGGKIPRLSRRELTVVVPLAALVVLLGVYPRPLTSVVDRSAMGLAEALSAAGPMQVAVGDVVRGSGQGG